MTIDKEVEGPARGGAGREEVHQAQDARHRRGDLAGRREVMTQDAVVEKLRVLQDAIWHVTWDLHPTATRLLSVPDIAQLEAIRDRLNDTIDRLRAEVKPKGWRRGQRVTLTSTIDAGARTPAPVVGSQGTVDRVMRNEYGWWVVVAFTGSITDVDGTVWEFGNDPCNIYFKPDELVKGWKKSKTRT